MNAMVLHKRITMKSENCNDTQVFTNIKDQIR